MRSEEPTMSDKLVSAAMWVVALVFLAGWSIPVTALAQVVHPDRTDALTRFFLRGQLWLTWSSWRAEVDPAVRDDRQYVFATNHVNMLDFATMYRATPHFKQGMNLAKHFKIPVYGWFMKGRGTIAVNPGEVGWRVRLRKAIQQEIEANRSILVFPEGTRTRDGRVRPFKKGIFEIAHELELEIVPVAVTGMHEVLSTADHLLRPFGEVVVHVMAPVPTKGVPLEELPALVAHVQAQVAAKVDAVYD